LAVSVSCAVVATSAYAQNQPHGQANLGGSEGYGVIAHIEVPGAPATQMRLQNENGRQYLYMVQGSGAGFSVVDVTKPREPAVVKEVKTPTGTSTNGLVVAGSTMVITEGSSSGNNAGQASFDSIQLFDTSDPANPRPVHNFTDVSSVLTEDARHLVYVATKQGLYIVRRPVKPTNRPCTTADQMSAMPNCH